MPNPRVRPVERKRWRDAIERHLEDFPRQYTALEHAMASFGGNFDVQQFKAAYDTAEDMDAYNRVQAVERALGRVQNYVGELAETGVKLAALPQPAERHASQTETAFEAMRDSKIITATLCRRLVRAQDARTRIEHSYVRTPAGDVHGAAILVRDTARDFIGSYRDWIEPFLAEPES
jgi:phage-related tail protein